MREQIPQDALQRLVEALRCLPGVGPKSAQRMAFHLLQNDRPGASLLGESLLEAVRNIRHCAMCNTFSEAEVCSTCADDRRDPGILCVVETPADQIMVEQTLTYKGLYFVLTDLTAFVFLLRVVVVSRVPRRVDFCSNSPIN